MARLLTTFLPALLMATFLTTGPAHAQAYTTGDLETLVQRQEFAEAVAHLQDVPPSARNAAWEDIAARAALGNAALQAQQGCATGYEWIKAFRLQAGAAVRNNPALKHKQVELGICVMRERRGYSGRDRDDLAAELLALDPAAIGPLVSEGGYHDRDARLPAWVNANAARAQNDARLRESLLSQAGQRPSSGNAAGRMERYKALRAAGWYDDWVKQSVDKLNKLGDAYVRGEFPAATGEDLILNLRESGWRDDLPAARVLLPQAVRLSSARDPRRIEMIRPLSAAALAQAAAEMVKARPAEGFWFEGPSWDEGTAFADIRKAAPGLVLKAVEECRAYRADASRVPLHVWRSACEWLGV